MRVGIIGGGIAGLTAAHLLSGRSDVEVEVFEAESVFGGRANVTKDGEHCTRFFLDDYHHLLAILQTIPQSDGTLYDRLTATRRLVLGRAGNWIDADHMYAFLSRDSVPIRDKVAISNANRRSLLVARRAERDRYASVWNWSPPALLRALRASTPASGHPVAFPGPTDTYFVNPWVAHLRDRGVLLHCSSPVISFSERHDGVEIRTPAASVNFDVVIVTAFAPDAYALLDRSGVARPLDRRTHTHCKCLTIRLAPNEPILSDPTLRAYSWAGVTAVVQPTHQRCVMLAAYAATSDTTTLLTQLRNNLPLRHELIEVQVRDNLALNEAVFFGTQVQPAVLESALQGRVFFAGSYLANSYAVDSAEGACRTAVHAVARATECHPSLMRAPRLSPGALPPANMRQRVPVVAHPNSPRTGADGLWRLVRIVNRVATPLPARIQFLYLDAFDWDPEQPAVYVANHRSIFDVPAGILAFDRLKVFPRLIIAERYFKGATGLALNTLGAIPAVRGSDATISAAVAAVRAGESVAFMVEGRVTSPEEAVSAAHGRGAFEVACRTGVPVIPIGGSGTHEVWATARAWPLVRRRRPLVTIAIGAAEHPGDDSCEGLAKRVRDGLHVLERTAEKYRVEGV